MNHDALPTRSSHEATDLVFITYRLKA